ncbi:MAG: hypothetical protein JWQ57_3626 [Mucilaginibacter sp.]|nr:hypothetical protein [Mucilaginibacter sp.]
MLLCKYNAMGFAIAIYIRFFTLNFNGNKNELNVVDRLLFISFKTLKFNVLIQCLCSATCLF